MNPELSSFTIGLLFGAAKVGLIGSVGFAIAWWRSQRKVAALQASQASPEQLEERLAALERTADYTATQLKQLVDGQATLLRQLPPQLRGSVPGPETGEPFRETPVPPR
jgi:hypothetical protein